MSRQRGDQLIRWLIVAVTFAFLTVLWANRAADTDDALRRHSISAYYYHDQMVVWFVGALIAVGILLFVYRGASRGENRMLNAAGLFLILVAVFPMDWPADGGKLSWHAWIHYIAAVLFFVCLGVVSIFQGKQSLRDRRDSTQKLAYSVAYNFAGWGMIGVPWLAMVLDAKGARSAVYQIECSAVVVFAAYWLTKILEFDVFRLEQADRRGPGASEISQIIQDRMESTESLGTRLAGAADAQRRTRLVLVALTVPCAALFIASYNAYLSFDRLFTLQEVAVKDADLDQRAADGSGRFAEIPTRKFDKERGNDILVEQSIKTWSDSRSISSSLLGIRVSIDDAPVLGSSALFVISIWFLLSVRREYYTIYFLLKDTRQLNPSSPDLERLKVQWRVYHGIISSSVFSLYWRRFFPVYGGLTATTGVEQRIREINAGGHVESWSERVQSAFLTLIVKFIFWLPVTTLVFVIVFDRISYYERSPYRENLVDPESAALSGFEILSLVVFAVFTFLLVVIMTLASTYNEHTEQGVTEYYDNICLALRALSSPAIPAAEVGPPPEETPADGDRPVGEHEGESADADR